MRTKVEVPPKVTCPRCKKSNRDGACSCYSSGEFWDMQRQLADQARELDRLRARVVKLEAVAAVARKLTPWGEKHVDCNCFRCQMQDALAALADGGE